VKFVLVAILSRKDCLAFGDERLWLGYGAPFLDDWQMTGDLNNKQQQQKRQLLSMTNQQENWDQKFWDNNPGASQKHNNNNKLFIDYMLMEFPSRRKLNYQ